MEGKDADTAIGIGVGPGMGEGSVVDGQNLQHPLVCGGHEVNHLPEVAEVAHTKAALGA